jgi:hypothetical protein
MWTQPEIVGADFRTRTEIGTPTLGLVNTAFTPSTLSSAKPRWQMMWHGLKVKVLSLKR